MNLYLYRVADQTLTDVVEGTIYGRDCLRCIDGSTLVLPQGVEVSSKEDLSEKLLERHTILNPDQATRLGQIEELMMEMLYGGTNE